MSLLPLDVDRNSIRTGYEEGSPVHCPTQHEDVLQDQRKLIKRAMCDAIYAVSKRRFELLLNSGEYDLFINSGMEAAVLQLQTLTEHVENLGDSALKSFETVWITLSPEPDHKFDEKPLEFAEIIKKWLDKCKYVEAYRFAIEQRGETEEDMGKGIHAHIVFRRVDGQTYTRYVEWVKRTWAKYHGVNYKFFAKNKTGAIYFKDKEFYDKKVEYLLGNKTDAKQSKVSHDKIWREKVGLEQIYSNKNLT